MKLEELSQIFEIRDAFLYHGTFLYALAHIINENFLHEGIYWGKPHEKRGPRLTRSYNTAWKFADNAEWPVGGVLAFRREVLLTRYKVQPYKDTDLEGYYWPDNEFEEIVITPEIKPLDQFLEFFVCPDKNIAEGAKDSWLEEAVMEEIFETVDQGKKLLEQLYNHPKRKSL